MRRNVRTAHGMIEYELIQTDRRSFEIRVIQGGQVRVFAPKRVALKEADAFVSGRAEWIFDIRSKMAAYIEQKEKEHPVQTGATVLFRGEPVGLRIERGLQDRVWMSEDGFICVEARDVSGEAPRELIREWMVLQAMKAIGDEVEKYVSLVGKRPGRITIREQRTRWGSCSNRDNLNFNWKLIMAPREALTYVVVHELCHLWEFNHSARFWTEVGKIQPDYEVWRDWLKQNGKLLVL